MNTSPKVDKTQSPEVQELQKRDIALFFKEDGDEGFNPKRNKAIISQTIRKNEENRKRILREEEDNIRERADAVATYLKSKVAEGSSPVEKYFGKRYLAYLRGMKITNILKSRLQNQEREIYLPK